MAGNQEKYNQYIVQLLRNKDCEVGSVLCKNLCRQFDLTEENARQILNRAVKSNVVKSSSPISFGKGQFAYSLSGNMKLTDVLMISKKNRPPLYRLLWQMWLNEGIISYFEGIKATSSLVERSSTKVSSFDELLSICVDLDLAYKHKDINNVDYLILKVNGQKLEREAEYAKVSQHYQKMVIDCTLLPDIVVWLQNVNIMASGPIYRNKVTPGIGCVHNKLVWDAYGYTKATGFNPRLNSGDGDVDKGTLVVLDVVLSTEYTDAFLDAFYERIQININSTKGPRRKVLPIVIFNSISTVVKNKMKKMGFLAFDLAAIFGSKITEVVSKTKMLPQMLTSPERLASEVSDILKGIENSGQMDALSALRGTLFEFLMYPIIRNRFGGATIDRGRTLSLVRVEDDKEHKEYYEYDYIIHNNTPKEIVIVEVKGYHNGYRIKLGPYDKKNTLKWFFNKTLPFAREFYKKQGIDYPVKGVYITSAYFDEDCNEHIEKIKSVSKSRPSGLDNIYNRDELLQLLEEFDMKNEINTINRFYVKDED